MNFIGFYAGNIIGAKYFLPLNIFSAKTDVLTHGCLGGVVADVEVCIRVQLLYTRLHLALQRMGELMD